MANKPARSNPESGMSFDILIPGKFYQGVTPGGFGDSLTGIHIDGPRAIIDTSTKRHIIGLTDLPEPIQLPHFKLVIELSESGKEQKEIEKAFNAADENPIHEAFALALATGIIRLVTDEEMEAHYPETWEARNPKYVWRADNLRPTIPMIDMLRDAQDEGKLARLLKNTQNIATAKEDIHARQAEIDKVTKPVDGLASVPAKPLIKKPGT